MIVKRKPKSSFNEHYEAATRGALYEKVFLEISQNSQESTCIRLFSIKFQALGLHLEAQAQVFSCEFCKIAMNTFLQNSSGRLLLNIFLAIKISQVTMKLVKFLDELNYILHN